MQRFGKLLWAKITGKYRTPRVFITHPDFLNGKGLYKSAVKTSKYIKGLVLDVGSGKSAYLDIYREANDTFRYFSIDYPASREVMLVESDKPDIYGDAHYLPFKNAVADVVLFNQVLEHVPEPNQVLGEISGLLKKGGNLVISVPFIYQIHGEPFDFYRYTKYGVTYLLKKNGFEIEEFMPNGYFGVVLIELINGFIMEVFTRNIFLKAIGFFVMPLIFIFTNTIGILLEFISEKFFRFEAFTPNYWIVAKKV